MSERFMLEPETSPNPFTPSELAIRRECGKLADFLVAKNRAYGDSALDPVRVMSQASADEQIRVRMDDKLSRLFHGAAAGEDTMRDLVGYWVLLQVLSSIEPSGPVTVTAVDHKRGTVTVSGE